MQYTNDINIDSEHITAESTYTMRNNAFSFGAILNPQLASAQVHGGVAMGLGYALSEQMLFDGKTGKMLNDNLLDYKIPTSMDIPPIEVAFVETYEPTGPFGNKALGEPPLIPGFSF